jgi:3-hydroxyisobutyrate dehydrogenase-like beta-hydroxyacid dehydrogenase
MEPQPVRPVFDVVGSGTVWLGPAGAGSRTKRVLDTGLVDLTEATAETLRLDSALGLGPAVVIGLLESSPLGSPYAMQQPGPWWAATSPRPSPSDTPSRTPDSRRTPRIVGRSISP